MLRQRHEQGVARVARLNIGEMAAAKTLEGAGSEERLEGIRARFRRLSRRLGGSSRRRIDGARLGLTLWLTVWASCVGAAVSFSLAASGEGTAAERLRHLASYPNCMAARAVGVAPANVGEPGYWPTHDADQDGVACEPYDGEGAF